MGDDSPHVHPLGLPYLWLPLLPDFCVPSLSPPLLTHHPQPPAPTGEDLASPAIQGCLFSGEAADKLGQALRLWHWSPQAHPAPAALNLEPKPRPLGPPGSECLQSCPWPKPKVSEEPP